jgi:hypothetical protein
MTRRRTEKGPAWRRVGLGVSTCAVAAVATLVAGQPAAQAGKSVGAASIGNEMLVDVDDIARVSAVVDPVGLSGQQVEQVGTCTEVSAYSDGPFSGGGSIVLQLGFGQDEIAVATYTLDPAEFPIKIISTEMVFGTAPQCSVQTVTEWSIIVWDGTPSTGSVVAEFFSDDLILPHLRLGPGAMANNIFVTVDPEDPEQIFVFNKSGTNQFSIGYRIDQHHNQTLDPCVIAPPASQNAFPATDADGLQSVSGNWLCQVGGAFCACPGAGQCRPFSQLGICQPSGDWIMRATWESTNCQPNVGACCAPDGSCTLELEVNCSQQGGIFAGEGTTCEPGLCPEPDGACCFMPSGCLDLREEDCTTASGTWLGPNTSCSVDICFPMGSCCLPDGSCAADQSPEDCESQGGAFQGDGTDCGTTNCPDPLGACCLSNGGCLDLTEADCGIIPESSWAGFGTDCSDGNTNGTADACESSACAGDITGPGGLGMPDGNIDSLDYLAMIGQWGSPCAGTCEADITGPTPLVPDGDVNALDFLLLIGQWGSPANCP